MIPLVGAWRSSSALAVAAARASVGLEASHTCLAGLGRRPIKRADPLSAHIAKVCQLALVCRALMSISESHITGSATLIG